MEQAYELDISADENAWSRVPRRCRDFEEAKHVMLGVVDVYIDRIQETFSVRLRKVP